MLITVKILNDFLTKFDIPISGTLKADKIKIAKRIIKQYSV